jgi:hypothetical protein
LTSEVERPSSFSGSGFLTLLLAMLAGALFAPVAHAQDEEKKEDRGGWSFRIVPYLWYPSLQGEGGTKDGGAGNDGVTVETDVESSLGLNFAFMLAGEARNGRYGIGFDGAYVDVTGEGSLSGLRTGPVFEGELRIQGAILQLPLMYRLVDQDHVHLDLIVGARAYILAADVDAKGSLGGFGREVRDDASDAWVDPISGVRAGFPVVDWLELGLQGDVGGFGLNDQWSWQAQAGVRFHFGDTFGAMIGYRALYVSYESKLDLDLLLLGPFLGFEIRF